MHPLRRLSAASALVAVALVAGALPTLAKGDLEARLDAPIARDTPGGTELLVAMTVTFPDGDVQRPVAGSPIYLKLIAPDGTVSDTFLRREPERGHYVFRIAVPPGGVSAIEVGMRGTSDWPIPVIGDATVAGGITPTTAQVAPPATPPATLASLPPAVLAAEADAGAATDPTGVPAPVPGLGLAAVASLAVAAAVAVAVAVRRSRGSRGLAGPRQAPGA